ncbi:Asp-tRNA(Asn)/Glu-tRNA(Gln) amidotransferase subunit GatC [Novipirellula artificiosorum]|uniref:Aspartyl/glutamyl-tRNA(Asn/Gln) amidotransferase subunit C n=1 Tax=Novipirellula artificiosorum TaxID=2528016 RepID=A0A5C6E2X6_9BACT|nr:Asp-tRNA(Asn)/Glu-tRNA(Gln) amidotransferase subunit GatC [Novipirellula artificiosorum]TWU41971.1 Glutamyl-tRNA(Gln) amidotransferase subunit C [Novipirellula artificiosorum]
MALSTDDVRRLARLARLELSDEEIDAIGPQITKILGFVEQLSELDTDDVEPMTTALDVDNRWRPDQPLAGLTNDEALQNAPARDEDCFLVPPVLGTAATKH